MDEEYGFWKDLAEDDYDRGHEHGYRAGLEAAAKMIEHLRDNLDPEYYVSEVTFLWSYAGDGLAARIRALAPDNTLRSPSSTERAG